MTEVSEVIDKIEELFIRHMLEGHLTNFLLDVDEFLVIKGRSCNEVTSKHFNVLQRKYDWLHGYVFALTDAKIISYEDRKILSSFVENKIWGEGSSYDDSDEIEVV